MDRSRFVTRAPYLEVSRKKFWGAWVELSETSSDLVAWFQSECAKFESQHTQVAVFEVNCGFWHVARLDLKWFHHRYMTWNRIQDWKRAGNYSATISEKIGQRSGHVCFHDKSTYVKFCKFIWALDWKELILQTPIRQFIILEKIHTHQQFSAIQRPSWCMQSKTNSSTYIMLCKCSRH